MHPSNKKIMYPILIALSMLTLSACQPKPSTSNNVKAKETMTNNKQLDTATFGGGCFWCMEAVYQDLRGVEKVESGFSGGHVKNPAYKEVCNGTTGHAEVTQIIFDPSIITYKDLVDILWHVHNPTTLNQQGNDVGTQYRSAIFYHNEEQKKIAEASKAEAEQTKVWPDPIVTEISPFSVFYKAEDYHQNYFKNNPNQPYCVYVVNPKVQKFKKQYHDKLK
jgi:peptide-methionine (S)-S-oxide reductase